MSANDRIQWLHKMVSEQCYPNAKNISEKFDISPRQAQRDIEHTSCTVQLTEDITTRQNSFSLQC